MDGQNPNIIYSYTRAQAIADGVLIDVTAQACETGFLVPVAISDHLYTGYIVPSAELDGKGRLHDVLMMTLFAIRDRLEDSRVYFEVLFQIGEGLHFEKVQCVAIVGPGDEGEAVMTICLPEDE